VPAFYHLDDTLLAKGSYVKKPVHGRGGANVTIHDDGGESGSPTVTTTEGQFADDVVVYQAKIHLKKFDSYFPIFGGWVVSNRFAGAAVREDHSRVTSLNSCVAPLRILRDEAPVFAASPSVESVSTPPPEH
jgi:glutathionylspermidine synthase